MTKKIIVMYNWYDNKAKQIGDKNGVLEFISSNNPKYFIVDKKQAKRFFDSCPDISSRTEEGR